MKKILFLLFMIGSIYTYSNSKCEAKATEAIRSILGSIEKDISNVNYLGQNNGNPPYYLYEVTGKIDGKILMAVDMTSGSIYISKIYPKNTAISGKDVDFELILGDEESLICK